MLKRVSLMVVVLTSLALTVSCGSKKKAADEAAPVGGQEGAALDSNVSTSGNGVFDAAGSDSGKISRLSTVNYDYDSSTLSSDSRRRLAENAEWIKGNMKATVQIEGHCDSRGSVEYNLALGERRAKSVKNYLVSLGIDSKRLTIISYGEEKPIATGESEDAYAKNRRANFVPLTQ
jgi:peptidoglycan-associated lipoprotein